MKSNIEEANFPDNKEVNFPDDIEIDDKGVNFPDDKEIQNYLSPPLLNTDTITMEDILSKDDIFSETMIMTLIPSKLYKIMQLAVRDSESNKLESEEYEYCETVISIPIIYNVIEEKECIDICVKELGEIMSYIGKDIQKYDFITYQIEKFDKVRFYEDINNLFEQTNDTPIMHDFMYTLNIPHFTVIYPKAIELLNIKKNNKYLIEFIESYEESINLVYSIVNLKSTNLDKYTIVISGVNNFVKIYPHPAYKEMRNKLTGIFIKTHSIISCTPYVSNPLKIQYYEQIRVLLRRKRGSVLPLSHNEIYWFQLYFYRLILEFIGGKDKIKKLPPNYYNIDKISAIIYEINKDRDFYQLLLILNIIVDFYRYITIYSKYGEERPDMMKKKKSFEDKITLIYSLFTLRKNDDWRIIGLVKEFNFRYPDKSYLQCRKYKYNFYNLSLGSAIHG